MQHNMQCSFSSSSSFSSLALSCSIEHPCLLPFFNHTISFCYFLLHLHYYLYSSLNLLNSCLCLYLIFTFSSLHHTTLHCARFLFIHILIFISCVANVVNCPNYTLRATFFYVLGLVGRNQKGIRQLARYAILLIQDISFVYSFLFYILILVYLHENNDNIENNKMCMNKHFLTFY
jgi:Rapamycin-insensitive companion of mTOR, domain 5